MVVSILLDFRGQIFSVREVAIRSTTPITRPGFESIPARCFLLFESPHAPPTPALACAALPVKPLYSLPCRPDNAPVRYTTADDPQFMVLKKLVIERFKHNSGKAHRSVSAYTFFRSQFTDLTGSTPENQPPRCSCGTSGEPIDVKTAISQLRPYKPSRKRPSERPLCLAANSNNSGTTLTCPLSRIAWQSAGYLPLSGETVLAKRQIFMDKVAK